MQLVQTFRFQPGDIVRYVGKSREASLSILPGTLGSIVSGPFPRRASPAEPERMTYKVMFGYRTTWMPGEKLEAEQS